MSSNFPPHQSGFPPGPGNGQSAQGPASRGPGSHGPAPQYPSSPYGAPPSNQQWAAAPQQGQAPQFGPAGSDQRGGYGTAPGQQSSKEYVVAWLLALFLGALGADRFYRGFIGLGILKLLTCGGAGIWALIDLLIILFTGGKDSQGLPLANYEKNKKVSWIVTAVVLLLGFIVSIVNGATSGPDEASLPGEPAEIVATAPAEVADAAEQEVAAEPEEPEASEPAPVETTEAPVEKPAAVAADVPAAQQSMTDAVAQGRTDAESAETDLQRANVLNVRSDTLCETIPEGEVNEWVGTVVTVDANGEGKAVVVVSIEEDIEIGTWNNAFSDISDNTLIEQGTPLYDAALALAPGDTVTFSGTLKPGSEGNDSCYYASNLTEAMSIDSPDYIITFDDLKKVE